jgi:GT2 family glycosyltransferase
MSRPLVTIIILNWNGIADTTACLNSLKKITYPNFRVIVVDNGSRDNEGARLKKLFGDSIEVVRNEDNLGYTGGNNVGIRRALDDGTDFVLLLNNDTTVEPDFLDRLVTAAEKHPTIGILGPKIYLDEGRRTLWSAGGWVDPITSFCHRNPQEEPYRFYAELVRTGYVIGAAMLIRREVLRKVGLLDERFFAYEEDIEYCVRARRAGFDSVLVTTSVAYHTPGSSVKNRLPLQPYYQTRNSYLRMRAIFADNRRRFLYGAVFTTMVNCINVMRAFRDEGWSGWPRVWAIVRGMCDALVLRRYGKTRRYPH